ncbi:hypothetical protein K5I29_10690 [Flavobacterium agricola]|uniref:Zinc finger protein n=1 Tax=Flavobacterium agricola TaxID=2870839 RepID=A0ABY6M166_9FLAO|nr:hypothetical protein [Flavobacterium agricola]UYW00958.1 hypothetical protein K5I29_10690 [Flavobacterium agricola]
MIQNILHKLFLSCNQATLRMERDTANQLSTLQKIRLKSHLALCKNCKTYHKKVLIMDAQLQKVNLSQNQSTQTELEALKQKVKKSILEKN